jgi:hypothetical protein
MNKRDQVERTLFIVVLIGIGFAELCSCVHMVSTLAWANTIFMAYAMAACIVVLSGVLLALSVLLDEGSARVGLQIALGALMLTEMAGNYVDAGLLVSRLMPPAAARFMGLSPAVGAHLAAWLFAAVVPAVGWLALYSVSKVAEDLLDKKEVNAHAFSVLHGELGSDAHAAND